MPDHPVPHPDVAGFVLGVLEPDEADAFAQHLRSCDDCRREVTELSSLRVLLDQALPAPSLPEGLADRTLAAVAAEASTRAPRAIPLRPRRRRPRLLPAALAVAGAAAVARGLLVAPRQDGPAGREIALVAADGSPSGTVARLSREAQGIVVELGVAGLPDAGPGRFYECWYVADADGPARPARVSAGTFAVPASGTTTVRMTTAADRTRYPRIEVTLEPDDGDPRATGPVVLRSPPRPPSD